MTNFYNSKTRKNFSVGTVFVFRFCVLWHGFCFPFFWHTFCFCKFYKTFVTVNCCNCQPPACRPPSTQSPLSYLPVSYPVPMYAEVSAPTPAPTHVLSSLILSTATPRLVIITKTKCVPCFVVRILCVGKFVTDTGLPVLVSAYRLPQRLHGLRNTPI